MSNYTRTIVCLANSRKMSGRCIAGKEWDGSGVGGWIRPVSERHTHEISEEDRRYKDGTYPVLLEIIQITFKVHQPTSSQPENHLIDDGYYWSRRGVIGPGQINAFLDTPSALWSNGDSSGSGINDRVSIHSATPIAGSLFLIRVHDLAIRVCAAMHDKRTVRAQFSYHGDTYNLRVTDPVVESQYLKESDGVYPVGLAHICVSLADPLNDYYYKLVAAVLPEEQA